MAVTSGQTSFNLELTELVEEAFERAVAEIAAISTRVLAELPPRKQPPKTVPPLRR